MKIYILRYYNALCGEEYTRSAHMTHKGVLMEQCWLLLEVLLDMEWGEEDLKEMDYIHNIIGKDDPITIDELIQHINVLQSYAEIEDVYAEIEGLDLRP